VLSFYFALVVLEDWVGANKGLTVIVVGCFYLRDFLGDLLESVQVRLGCLTKACFVSLGKVGLEVRILFF
jgi:hypothetical protein